MKKTIDQKQTSRFDIDGYDAFHFAHPRNGGELKTQKTSNVSNLWLHFVP